MNWKEEYRTYLEKERSEKTVEAYMSDLRQFESWFERVNAEALHPEVVTGVDCHDFRSYQLQEEEVAPSTWNRRRVALIVFTDWAMDQGYLKEDPMLGVDEKPVEELPLRWLDEGEYREVIRYLDKEVNRALTDYEEKTALMYRAIVHLMLFCGLRVGEVVDLRRKDIEINERSGTVFIRDGKGEKAAEVFLDNAKARRVISAWLEYLKERSREYRQHLWEKGHTEPVPGLPLWYGRKGDPLSSRSIQNHVQEIGEALGLEITPHTFRHTFVRRLLVVHKVPVNIVQKLARHARVETTLSYAGVSRNDMRDALRQL